MSARSEPSDGAAHVAGVVVSLLTPFSDDGSAVNIDDLQVHVEWLISKGIHGLFVAGTYGEGPLLTHAERRTLLERVVAGADRRVQVLAQTGCMTTSETVELTRHANAAGADAAVLVAPWYYAYDDLSLYTHFATVAAAVPDFPIYLYNSPAYARNAITPALAARLAQAHPNVRGVKDSSKSLATTAEFVTALGPSASVLVGTDGQVLPALHSGAAGAVSAVANVYPELLLEVYDRYRSGGGLAAQAAQDRLSAVREVLKGAAGIALYKYALPLRGLPSGGLRLPARELTAGEQRNLHNRLASLGVITERDEREVTSPHA